MTALHFDQLTAKLRQRLAQPLPGTKAQLTMAPDYRRDAELARVDEKHCREAGVLALLFPAADATPMLLLTARHADLENHAGQVSFPGGRRERGEELVQAALREAHEEVALPPQAVDMLGALTPLYIPPSNYCVYPFVGAVSHPPELRPTDTEVAEILRVPLSHLLAPETRRIEPWTLRGRVVQVPFYAIDDHQVWGATAMMLAELLAVMPASH